ncbi:MAG TPA: hypothetical protein VK533_06285 [Sphingomonas sp.]|uniref:hypothetical protein n=1 Tax=Sphingomonas sp. TaxID=28214 RepID=UPI002BA66FA1|nr:hypothetical protein [Sphingomonas sp.]HMI19133.1 hypothetical protein [Sphingomonas sp.]
MRTLTRTELIAVGMLACSGFVRAAQAAPAPTKATDNAVNVRTNQKLVGAGVGTGTKQGQSVATVSGKGQPALGVGAGSGQVQHFGSKGSVSVANNARLLGVDGKGGYNSPNSASVRNPTQKPVLTGAQDAAGTATTKVPH